MSSSTLPPANESSNQVEEELFQKTEEMNSVSQENENRLKFVFSQINESVNSSFDAFNQKLLKKSVREEFSKKNEGLIPTENSQRNFNSEFYFGNEVGCAICNSSETQEDNLLIICSGCNLMCHRSCFGIENKHINDCPEDDWFCPSCALEIYTRRLHTVCPEKLQAYEERIFSQYPEFVFDPERHLPNISSMVKSLSRDCGKSEKEMKFDFRDVLADVECTKNGEPSSSSSSFTSKGIQGLKKFDHPLLTICRTCPLCPCSGGLLKMSKHRHKSDFFENKNASYLNANKGTQASYTLWIHVTCAMAIPALRMPKGKFRKIRNVTNISPIAFLKKCSVCCLENNGVVVRCPMVNCRVYFHPECARRANRHLKIEPDGRLKFFCIDHHNLQMHEDFILAVERAAEVLSEILAKENSQPFQVEPVPKTFSGLSSPKLKPSVGGKRTRSPEQVSTVSANRKKHGKQKIGKDLKWVYKVYFKLVITFGKSKGMTSTSPSYRITAIHINSYRVYCTCLKRERGIMFQCCECHDWLHIACIEKFERYALLQDTNRQFRCPGCVNFE